MPIPRVLEPEVMDTAEEADSYDAMGHSVVNAAFAEDFLRAFNDRTPGPVLDVGTGTALIPLELMSVWEQPRPLLALDAADEMLARAQVNVQRAGRTEIVIPLRGRSDRLPFPTESMAAVMSNSLIHHLPDCKPTLREFLRVLRPGGVLFVRDLYRPDTQQECDRLVAQYAADETPLARQLFAQSLPAALTLNEIRAAIEPIAASVGLHSCEVRMTSDRHWTLTAVR